MFDLLFLVVVGVSTAFAALRGGLREVSTLLALAIAAGIAWLLLEPILNLTGQSGSFIGTAVIAVVLIAIFFIIAHIGLHLGMKRIPLEGRARLYDRVGGGAFGLFRGLVLVGLGYLGYSYYLDESAQPESVKTAITRPIAAGMANWFESFAPESTNLDQPATAQSGENETVDPSVNGYDRGDRNTLSEIVTTVTTTDDVPEPIEASELSDDDPIADILIEDDSQ